MSTSTRLTVAGLGAVLVLIVALAFQLRGPSPVLPGRAPAGQAGAAELGELRARADLPPCRAFDDRSGPERLRGVVVRCLADGSPVDSAQAVAGRPVLLNLWAYWCLPCADELPAMAEYQRRKGSQVGVITVHQDRNEGAALQRLADLGVRLPAWQDGSRQVAAALGVPNVMPATVVLRADSSVAGILPRAFVSADDIAAAVDQMLDPTPDRTRGVPGVPQ